MVDEQRFEPLPGLAGLPRAGWRRLSRRGRVVLGLFLAALAAGTAVTWPVIQQAKRQADTRERRQAAAREAAALRTLVAEQRPRSARLTSRRGPVSHQVEAAIGADARARAAAGVLDGPIRRTVCGPGAGFVGATGPGARRILRCLAVTSRPGSGSLIGHEFIARIDQRQARVTWCKNHSPPAHPETGQALARALKTPLPAACTRP